MSNMMIALGIAIWFALLVPVATRSAPVEMPPVNAPWAVPILLSATFAFALLVFNVEREDGTAVLQAGLSASNIMIVVITMTASLYVVAIFCTRPPLLLLPFVVQYRPYTLMFLFDLLSSTWSIEPIYTLYRCFEVGVFYILTLVSFDRDDLRRRLGLLLGIYISIWLALASPSILTNLAKGVVFSSGKNNTIPIVCAALMLWAVFEPQATRRRSAIALGFAGFVIAGSASSTGALIWGLPPALLMASPRPGRRVLGVVLGLVILLVFAFLIVGLSAFPQLVDVLAAILQKPADELERATGRTEIWPIFISATRDHMFGSGFSAADRFVQMLVPAGSFPDSFARDQFHFGSSHNMFLSAWAGTGVIGLGFAVTVLGSVMRRALRLDIGPRRFVLSVVSMLILNGLTTPGIFQDWGPMNLAFVAMVAYTRVGALGMSQSTVGRTLRWGRPAAVPVQST